MQHYWLPTLPACFPFTSPTVRHRVPSGFKRALVLDTPFSGVEHKTTGHPLHSHVSPSLPLPCVTVCHQVSTELYRYTHCRRNADGLMSGSGGIYANQCSDVWLTIHHHNSAIFFPRHANCILLGNIVLNAFAMPKHGSDKDRHEAIETGQ